MATAAVTTPRTYNAVVTEAVDNAITIWASVFNFEERHAQPALDHDLKLEGVDIAAVGSVLTGGCEATALRR